MLTNKKNLRILLALVLVLAAAIRLYNFTAISLWHDEAFSALLVNYSWHEMFYRIGLDVHPPLYYILLRFWADILGHSLAALRGFSVLFGVATVWMTYLFARAAFKKESIALITALFMALSPFQIQYVTEARMYTLGTFLVMTAAYLLVKSLEEQKNTGKNIWTYWILLGITNAAMYYTHYYLFFSAFAIGLAALYYLRKDFGLRWQTIKYAVVSYALSFLLFIPWLKVFLFQFHQVQDTYWIPKINKWSVPIANWRMIFGTRADPGGSLTNLWLILALLISLFAIYWIAKKDQVQYKGLVLLGLIVPFLGSFALSLKQSIFLDRYFLFASLFLIIIAALLVFEIKRVRLKYFAGIFIAFILAFTWALTWQHLDVEHKKGMSAASNFINSNASLSDKIFVMSSSEFFNFEYYNHTGIAPLLYTPGISGIKDLPHFSGTALLTDQDLLHDFTGSAPSGTTAWVIWTNAYGGTKPVVPNNWVEVDEKGWQDVWPYEGTWVIVTEYRVN